MTSPPTSPQVLTAEQMRMAEQCLFDAGMPEFDLMKLAAGRAAEWIRRIAASRSVTVLCGPGNNGGDGYVIAYCLHAKGLSVSVIAPEPPKTPSAKTARELWGREVLTSGGSVQGEVFVDCLFGSGLSRPLSGAHALLLRDLAERHAISIALDVPSGIASDTGALLNERTPFFDVTLALGAWKFAHWSLPGREHMGTLRLVDIGIDEVEEAAKLVTRPALAAPQRWDHKYTRGYCAVVAGNLPGASILAALAAQRAGAGYVKLMHDAGLAQVPPQILAQIPSSLPVSHEPLPGELKDGRLGAVLVGQGLGNSEKSREILKAVLDANLPAVVDAEGLRLLGEVKAQRDAPRLATPHEGELAALCKTFSVIGECRLSRVLTLAKLSNMVICAKGPDTIIAAPDGRIALSPPASSWLSVAGTGDVLAGIAVSRMAGGRPPFEAACEAVWIHGEAARQCGPAFTADELAHAVSAAYGACL